MSEHGTSRDRSRKSRAIVWSCIVLVLLLAGAGAAFYLVPNQKRGGVRTHHGKTSITISHANGGHQLIINGQPFLVRGVCYNPIPVGEGFDYNFWTNSAIFEADGKLMQEANVNTIRLYRVGKNSEDVKSQLNKLYSQHKIYALMGHHLGFWEWPPPEYADQKFRDRIQEEVMSMVKEYKDEPFVLAWVLGNENNYSFDMDVRTWSSDAIDALPTPEDKRAERAKIYYSWINDMAKAIKQIDKAHPVVLGIGETKSLEYAAKYTPDIDILGMIAYRGPSFGTLFREVKQKYDKPVLLTEFGCDRLNAITQNEEQNMQAEFIKMQWRDILKNTARIGGAKNCLGGTIFEWTDEWWKGNELVGPSWSVHDPVAHWRNPAYYFDADQEGLNNMNEEWFGVVALDPSKKDNGIDARVPTKSYSLLQSMWGDKAK